MSITAMQMPQTRSTTSRPRLQLLPEYVEPTTAPATRVRPRELDVVRAETDLVARQVCRTIGVRGTWGTSRWRATGDPAAVASTFEIQVAGPSPCLATARRIAGRLAARGWTGGIKAMTPIVRIDAERDGYQVRLVATRRTITVRVSSAPVVLGETVAQDVLDGMFEDE